MIVSPDNSGTVKVDGGSAAVSYPAVFQIDRYSTIPLEAVPAAGYVFSHWSGAVTDTANPTSLYVDCDKTVTATFTPLMSRLYFPHVASQQAVSSSNPWKTEVCVINTGDQALSGILRSYRDNGQAVSSDKAITLGAHGRWSRIVGGGEFPNSSKIGYMVFESASESVVGYTKFYQEGIYRAAIPAVQEVNTSDIIISHIASDADWWTGVSLVNTTAETKELTITFNDGRTRNITLNANEHKVFSMGSLFNDQPQPGIESAVIAHASGVIGLELFGSLGWGTQLEGILLTDKTIKTLYYPHMAGNEWWTGIVAYNPSESEATITITPYSAGGLFFRPQHWPSQGKGNISVRLRRSAFPTRWRGSA